MNKCKRFLALLLVLCMTLSVVPFSAFAADGSDETTDGEPQNATVETVAEETTADETTGETTEETTVEETTEATTVETSAEEEDEPQEEDISSFLLTAEADVNSLTMGTKPADGTTTGNPFVKGTGGSNSFRIPAMATLNDGTIVAAADARWNTTYDGGGLDTIVSYSTDNGANWNYTFANFLGDNGNVYNGSGSTAFIDPALATDGKTVYMLCDLYPYGVALNGNGNTAPSTAVGFNSYGKLLLSADGTNYNYYLDGTVIKNSSDDVVSDYTVDAYFNITGTDGTSSNLFFSDSPFKVVRTGYLYLTKSADGGATWSAPTLIPNVKTSSEQVCLVGPGRGLVTGGKIIFPVYSYNGSSESQRMGFIYSSNGTSWTRVDSNISWSSEAAVVELSDGTLRFFYRNGTSALCYVDYSWTNGWGSAVNTGIATNSNTQISAIALTQTVDGKQVILVSCPTGSNNAGSADSSASARLNGRIQIGLVDSENYTMTWKTPVDVTTNNSQFMYSCLTALTDKSGNETGEVAILYEDYESAWGNGYYTMSFATYDLNDYVTFDAIENTDIFTETDADTGVTVTVTSDSTDTYEGWSMTVAEGQTVDSLKTNYVAFDIVITESDGTTKYVKSARVSLPVGNLNTANGLYGFVVESDGTVTKATDGALSEDGKTFTFTAPHFSVVGLAEEEVKEDTVSPSEGTSTSYVLDTDGLDSGAQYLIVYKNSTSATSGVAINTSKGSVNVTIDGNNATPTGDASAALWTITNSGNTYYLANGTNYLYPSRTWNSGWKYSLNISTTKTGTYLSGGTGAYSISSTDNYYKAYVRYNNGWTAGNSSQNLYFYKYTEGTQSWTVDPSLQEQRITNLTVTNDGYTTESWDAYQSALNAANEKLNEVKTASYSSEANAQAALKALTDLVDALETAKSSLKKTISITVNYQANGITVKTETLNVADDAESVTLSSTVVGKDGKTYDVSNTTLSLNLAETTTYNVEVTEREGVSLSIKENETTTISVDLAAGQYVKWSSADSNYVGVAGKYDTTAGAYTNEAILAGQNVTNSPVPVTGTVYNADGTIAGTYKWLVTVTEGDADTNTSSKGIYFNISTIENCTVYYSINGGELIPVNGTGVTTGNWTGNGTYTGHFNIMFFAAPNEGYALTYMSISGSADQYYTLTNGNPDGTGSDAWPFNDPAASIIPSSSSDSAWKTVDGKVHGFRWALLEGNMTIDQMKVLFSNAIALGCDGATTITKNGTDGMGSASSPTVCKFVAQKLPTVEKSIKSITHNGTETAYTDGMKVEYGDTITYTVTVTRPATNATYGTITYDNEKLTDDLTNNAGISNPDMGTSTTSDKTYTYTTSITLNSSNFNDVVVDGKITNTVDFSYSYSSQYSAGSLTSEASAVAEITVELPSYVIDFGLPVNMNMSELVTAFGSITRAEATYGDVTISGSNLTYTPNAILQGVDYIKLTLADGAAYQVAVYPATTVYYEEGFATYTGSWTGNASKGSGTQKTQIAGQSEDEYGYDAAYANGIGASNGSQATSSAKSDKADFTFTGTGVDIYANSTHETGWLMIQVKNGDGNTVKMVTVKLIQVDTSLKDGGEATTGQSVTGYNVPVASISGLSHSTYSVTISNISDSATVNLDGFRIYGTLSTEPDFYKTDKEDNPSFIELRDQVLAGLSVTSDGTGQVNAALPTNTKAVVVASSEKYTQENVNDLLANGPKNEIYLQPEQALVLKITTSREVQIGLKALNAETNYTINGDSKDISTSTDMFYTVLNQGSSGQQIITITNNGGGILSVTKLKVCDDPNASLASLTWEDLANALVELGIGENPIDPVEPTDPVDPVNPTDPVEPTEPEQPEVVCKDATLTVSLVDYTGKQITSVDLTANGVEGETKAFTAGEVLAAAKANVPKGYVLVDESKVTGAEVAFGQSGKVTVQIGKTATLKVIYVNLRGKNVGTATFTKVQTSGSILQISASDIRDNAPAGRRAVWLTNVRVPYGSEMTIVVPTF